MVQIFIALCFLKADILKKKLQFTMYNRHKFIPIPPIGETMLLSVDKTLTLLLTNTY